MPDLSSERVEETRDFYEDLLGFDVAMENLRLLRADALAACVDVEALAA